MPFHAVGVGVVRVLRKFFDGSGVSIFSFYFLSSFLVFLATFIFMLQSSSSLLFSSLFFFSSLLSLSSLLFSSLSLSLLFSLSSSSLRSLSLSSYLYLLFKASKNSRSQY
jgi:hypothetical protein